MNVKLNGDADCMFAIQNFASRNGRHSRSATGKIVACEVVVISTVAFRRGAGVSGRRANTDQSSMNSLRPDAVPWFSRALSGAVTPRHEAA